MQLFIHHLEYDMKPSINDIRFNINNSITEKHNLKNVSLQELLNEVSKGKTVLPMICDVGRKQRKKENFKQVNVIFVDIDDTITLENALNNDFVKEYCNAYYKTFSSSKTQDKFRLIFTPNRPIKSNEEYTKIMRYIDNKLGGNIVDVQTITDGSRMYLGTNKEPVLIDETKILNIDDIKSVKREKFKSKKSEVLALAKEKEVLKTEQGKIKEGGRNASLISYLGKLLNQYPNFAYEHLKILAIAFNNTECSPPDDIKNVMNTVDSAYSRYRREEQTDIYLFNDKQLRFEARLGAVLSHHLSEDLIYCTDSNSWFIYDGKLIKEDTTKVQQDIRDMVTKSLRYISDKNNNVNEVKDWLEKIRSADNLDKLIKSIPVKNADILGQANEVERITRKQLNPKDIIIFENGTLHIESGKFENEFNKNNYCTVMNEYEYDKNAECPLWDKFISEVTNNDKDKARLLQAIAGRNYLAGENKEQVMTVIVGAGGTGKSLYNETLKLVTKNTTIMTSADKLNMTGENRNKAYQRWETNKHIIFSESTGNIKGESMLNETAFKNITGDDEIEVKKLYKDEYVIENKFCYTLVTNYNLHLNNWDESILRRLEIFNWLLDKVKVKDINLKSKLATELSGIFNWLYKGYIDYMKNGIKKIDTSNYLEECKNNFMEENDRITQFVKYSLVNVEGEKSLKASRVFQLYTEFIEENYSHPLGKYKFYDELKSRGYILKDGTGNVKTMHNYLEKGKWDD